MNNSKYKITDFDEKYGHLMPQLDKLMDILHEGICISNADGVIVRMNQMYEKLAGVSPESMIGKTVSYLNGKDGVFDIPDPDAELIEKQDGIFRGPVSPLILKSKKPVSSIQSTKGGSTNLLHGYPLFDENGDVAMVVTFVRDISHLALFKENQMAFHKDVYRKIGSTINVIESNGSNSPDLIFESPNMKALWEQLKKIASTDATVLILGETGVGKGEIAKQIHYQSKRSSEVFFKADCTGIPENLIESELFGYAKGAFSGANQQGKIGYFSAADKGTIFLDEIGEIPLAMQAKLLRVLQDQEIMQLGTVEPTKVDVRVVAATNVDLETAVEEGKFRQDLFYRLNVSVLRIPPLRERQEEILPLANFFLKKYNVKYRKKVSFSEEIKPILLQHSWPGNIRELKNMVQGLVINCDEELISQDYLPKSLQKKSKCSAQSNLFSAEEISGKSLKDIMAKIERDILLQSFKEHGSMNKVAKQFNINRTTVSRKLKKIS